MILANIVWSELTFVYLNEFLLNFRRRVKSISTQELDLNNGGISLTRCWASNWLVVFGLRENT
jgi:hypothetical protein